MIQSAVSGHDVTVEMANAVGLMLFVFTGVVVHFQCQLTWIWKPGEIYLGVSVEAFLEDCIEEGTNTLSVGGTFHGSGSWSGLNKREQLSSNTHLGAL